MSDAKNQSIPQLCFHKASGLAVVRLNGKDHYCGQWDSQTSQVKYHRLIAEWLSSGVAGDDDKVEADMRIMSNLVAAYFKFVRQYYRKHGTITSEVYSQKIAIGYVARLYADLPIDEFGPRRLKACRQAMIEAGFVRQSINRHVGRIRQMFSWAAENEFIDAMIPHRLNCVKGLRAGRGGRESKKRQPAPWASVAAIEPHVAPQIWAMVQLQWHTGMRPGEVRIMRSCDIDTTGPVWLYRPTIHKTEHHDVARIIALGPQSQEIVRPWLRKNLEEFLFQPAEAMAMRCDRKPSKQLRSHYSRDTYHRAISRGVKQAFRPKGMEDDPFKRWVPEEYFSAHQLRHSFAGRVDKEFGLEATRVALGHQDANVTEIYIKRDMDMAIKVAQKIG